MGAADKGVSQGFVSVRPAGAVLGAPLVGGLGFELVFGLLMGVWTVPSCGKGDFRPPAIRADFGGTSGASSLFSDPADWHLERRCSGTWIVVSGIINFFKSLGEFGIRVAVDGIGVAEHAD